MAMVERTAVRNMLLPEALVARAAATFAQPPDTIVVHETDANYVPNELYDVAQLYLGACGLASAPALHLHKTQGASDVVASLPDDHTAWNMFRVVRVLWASWHAESNDAYSPSGFFDGGGNGWSGGFSYLVGYDSGQQ